MKIQGGTLLGKVGIYGAGCFENKRIESKLNDKLTLLRSDNKFTRLDVTGLSKLEEVNCGRNAISTLMLNGLESLKLLAIDENNFTQIDLSPVKNTLENFSVYHNALKELNIIGFTKLANVFCIENQLTSINAQGSNNLMLIQIRDNKLGYQGIVNLIQALPKKADIRLGGCESNNVSSTNGTGDDPYIGSDCYKINQLLKERAKE